MQTSTDSNTVSNEQAALEIASGYFAELGRSEDIEALHHNISTIVNRLGFSDYAYIQLIRDDIPQPEFCSLPTGLTHAYFDNYLYQHDLSLQKAASASEPFFYSTLHNYLSTAPFSNHMTLGMKRLYALNKSYGYYDYYYVTSLTPKTPAMLSITKRGLSSVEFRQHVIGCELTLSLLCEAIGHTIATRFPESIYKKRTRIPINPKPLRVLDTMANSDLTIEQIADKLSISAVTANQHLKTVRTTLGTKTNHAAIKRAVLENLIEFRTTPAGKPNSSANS